MHLCLHKENLPKCALTGFLAHDILLLPNIKHIQWDTNRVNNPAVFVYTVSRPDIL